MGNDTAGSAAIPLLKPREITFPTDLDVRIALGLYGWAVVNILATGGTALTGGSGKNLTIIRAIYSRYFENKPIVLGKTTNEYCPYLFAPWDCPRTKIVKHGKLPSTCATGPRRPYCTKLSMSTGPSSRPSWPARTNTYRHTLHKNSRPI